MSSGVLQRARERRQAEARAAEQTGASVFQRVTEHKQVEPYEAQEAQPAQPVAIDDGFIFLPASLCTVELPAGK
jgi:hypothetical protein